MEKDKYAFKPTREEKEEIVRECRGELSVYRLAKRFGIYPQSIYSILNKERNCTNTTGFGKKKVANKTISNP